jgi:uroporphyrinogen decarboxylase
MIILSYQDKLGAFLRKFGKTDHKMNNISLTDTILKSNRRLAMPIGVYAGLEITGATVYEAISDASIQAEAILALHERFDSPFLLTAMDLSAEAEVFGSEIRFSDEEIPTVLGRLITDVSQIDKIQSPEVGDKRTRVHLETAAILASKLKGKPVIGGCIGPFSLAGRLFGVSEALELSITDPAALHQLLSIVTEFLIRYVQAFSSAGASGIIIAEPAAGLLSPNSLGKFSSAYIHQIVQAAQTEDFRIILHNCGAKLVHLPKILESDAAMFHFGAPMDILHAIDQVPSDKILAGNLDPTAVFHAGSPIDVCTKTQNLLEGMKTYRNFVISSGCDLPPGTPIENLSMLYQTVNKSDPS